MCHLRKRVIHHTNIRSNIRENTLLEGLRNLVRHNNKTNHAMESKIDNYHILTNIPTMRQPGNSGYNNNYNLYQGNLIYMYYMFPHYYRAHPHNRQQGVAHSTVVGHNMERNTEHSMGRSMERSMERSMAHSTVVGRNTARNTVVGHNTHNMAHNTHNMVNNRVRSTPLPHIITDVDLGP
jgi:hypothetical protein